MQTSGLVLDVYDDFNGATLRELYPRFEDLPGQIKQAHVVTAEDHARLPDDVFALVMVNNGEKLRKYACVDEGNTALSVQYFLKHAHKLPEEAQKVAAENLKVACGWYGLPVPEDLEKVAISLGGAVNLGMTAVTAPTVIRGTHQAVNENLNANRQLEAQGFHGVITPEMRNHALGKVAEVVGTTSMPLQAVSEGPKAGAAKAVIKKTASMGRLLPGHRHASGDFGPEETERYDGYTKGRTAEKNPQARSLRPVVDVTNKEPPKKLVEKKASSFALPTLRKYPLDSYAQIKAASAYFDTYVRHMVPAARHEFAVHLVKRADAASIPVSDLARKYGSEDFAPEVEIKVAFDARRVEVAHNAEALHLLGEVEKVARYRMWKEAHAQNVAAYTAAEVVELLSEFDKVAGLDYHYDRSIPDPYYSVYGFEKAAEFSEVIGNETVTEADLRRLSRVGAHSVKTTFGEDFQEEFLRDPVGIFKSLPLDQKKMLMRMANSTQPGAERTYY